MAKIIKKQIWKTLPYFMIFSLVMSSAIGGVVFNFDFKLVKSENNNLNLEISMPRVQADTASTTVTVRNAPPAFSVEPEEYPVSTSTSPINVGDGISFIATADDPEGHSYYLLICSSAAASPDAGGGEPTCDDTQFCVSGLTADETETSCLYEVVDPGSETQEWYAYVCDNHASEADCNEVASQGPSPQTGDSSSPFYVNHAPTINAVSTTLDNQAPGGTFGFTATSTDNDVMGGDDVLTLFICDTNSWATSTGCAGTELCNATGTDDIYCEWTDTAPTVDQAYNYWAFVVDDNDMPASNNSLTNNYTIINVAPIVTGVYLVPNDGSDILLNLKEAPATTVIASSTTISDPNGCADLVSASSTIYWSNVVGEYDCAANDDNCYYIPSVDCSITNCSGAQATVTCDTTLEHFARPTDASSDVPATTWIAAIRVFDEALSGIGTTTVGTDVKTNTALDVTEATIPYGIIQAGQNSGTSTATTTVINFGNSPLDVELYGTDMTKAPDSIGIEFQEHSLSAYFLYGTGTNATSTMSIDIEDIITPRPTSLTNVYDNVYWGIQIPSGTPSGDYGGINTFSANLDASDW